MPRPVDRIPVSCFVLICTALLGACANSPPTEETAAVERSPADPWEPLNRRLYTSSVRIDRYTLKPVAKGYQKITPNFIERGIGNVFRNLGAPLNVINHLLQGKPGDGFAQTGRFLINSTMGVGGLFDVAARYGIDEKKEDFGQTLAVWGVPNGPYVFVPFLGPHTFRDATMIPLNTLADLLFHWEDSSIRDKAYILRTIDARARVFSIEALTEDAYDPYIRIREAYLQRRRYEVDDGDPPADEDPYEDLDEEFMDDEEFLDED